MKERVKAKTITEVRLDSGELYKLVDLIADRIVSKLLPALNGEKGGAGFGERGEK